MGESSSSFRAPARQEQSEGRKSDTRKGIIDDYQIQIMYTLQKYRPVEYKEEVTTALDNVCKVKSWFSKKHVRGKWESPSFFLLSEKEFFDSSKPSLHNPNLQIEISWLASAFSFFTHALQPQMLSVSDPRGMVTINSLGFRRWTYLIFPPCMACKGVKVNVMTSDKGVDNELSWQELSPVRRNDLLACS